MDGLQDLLPPLDPNPRAVVGGNSPPLAELLAEETVALKQRADDLVASAGRAAVTDDDTAGRATTLAKMLAEHAKEIDRTREERKRPFLDAGRAVDTHFGAIKQAVDGAKTRVVGLIDTYRRQKEAAAAAERRRLEEEAAALRRAAEEAERQRLKEAEAARLAAEEAARRIREAEEAARRANDKAAAEKARREREAAEAAERERAAKAREAALAAELEQKRRTDEAARLQQQADTTRAAPIDSGYGVKAFARSKFKPVITDLTAAIRHCRKVDEAAIRDCVQKIYDRQVRAGVRELPGADVVEDSTTTIR